MKQTPIQKMLEFTETQIDAVIGVIDDNAHAPSVLRFLKRQREMLQSLLPYERECIEGAYKEGAEDVEIKNNKLHYFISAQNYFTSTYNNPQGGGGE